MNRVKKLLFFLLTVITLTPFYLGFESLDGIVKSGNFKIILEEIDSSENKEKILKLVFKHREKFKKPDYEYFLRSLILREGLPEIYLNFFKKDVIFENEYIIFLKYFRDKNDLEGYIKYILRFDDEKNLDYKKITAQLASEGLDRTIYERCLTKSKLKLFVTARLFTSTNDDIYAKKLLDFDQRYILEIFDSDILNLKNKIKLVNLLDLKKIDKKLFYDEIYHISFYDLENDYTEFLKGSKFYIPYESFRKIFKGEVNDRNLNDTLFYPLYLIFKRDNQSFLNCMKGKKDSRDGNVYYLYFLYYLLNSDQKNLKEQLSKLLSSNMDIFVKIKCTNLYMLSKKISDGQFFFYYFANDYENMRPFILTVGKRSYLYYKTLIDEGRLEEAERFKENSFDDMELISEILLFEIKNGIIKKYDVEKYLKKYPKSPFKTLFINYL
ncbi:MAG: hypothetical protein QME48_01940 [bacterium]|uniref:Uncharacterized protein n=2 Tax=Bacteria candidate phyla TaxID=1783234 RepID=A0A101I2C3_UNCT6|nr:MAG: hypothetical protein XD76_0909 [candidate division TA06 bacterium 32_111]KUK87184.1 MAG: hypothetical protein XE03_0980 [candidate division TA06 bacterium 34_109]MDI6699977.1 hypothetical protein [bacterium]HAF07675.1 hypothetical protein [candidate division WOR-3 bacterium]HCP17053.1 hypothetical protein [candidate division WOR-3 bacterium]